MVLSIIGGILGSKFDFLNLGSIFQEQIVFAIYTALFLVVSFPVILIIALAMQLLATLKTNLGARFDIEKVRLVEEMIVSPLWVDSHEHSLTLVNESGKRIRDCYVLLDEAEWKNFEGEWETMSKEVFDRPFKWNRPSLSNGKLDLDTGERASFAFMFHHEYSIYNSTKKQNETATDFYFLFWGDVREEVGYGPDIRIRISIRGKREDGKAFKPIPYLLRLHLMRPHGLPKVDLRKAERLNVKSA